MTLQRERGMRRVRLTFLDHMIRQPVIYQMGRDFDVVTNIRRADVQENVGWVILELEGGEEEIDRALDWARDLGVRVDPALGDLVEG
ncbi:MAG: NIL domain-containing protein [Chloroflexota bacterium]|nr:NIL domain-containing protein [Chloroflexota bacterium]